MKYQVTIPKEVRKRVRVVPGVVSVEAVSDDEIRLKRFLSFSEPLGVLIGSKKLGRSVQIEELERNIESR